MFAIKFSLNYLYLKYFLKFRKNYLINHMHFKVIKLNNISKVRLKPFNSLLELLNIKQRLNSLLKKPVPVEILKNLV